MKNMKTLKTLSILLALVMILLTLPLNSFSVDLDELTDPNENWIEELIWELIYKPLLKPVVATKGLPENAEAGIKVVNNPFTRKSSSGVGTFLDFYDISVKDKSTGEELHPVGEVEVTIESARIKSGQSVYILHVLDDENVIKNSKDAKNFKLIDDKAFVSAFKTASAVAEKALGKKGVVAVEVIDDVKVEGRNVTFKTNCFSIFAVVDEPILTVNFYKDETNKIVSIRVKARDVEDPDEFEKIVYDPGVNNALEDNVLFRGWFESPDYTVEDAEHNALTIAQVREKIAEKLATNYSDGDEIDFYAMLYKQYTVTYFDQAGKICLGRDYVLQRADTAQGEIDYQVTLNYVPYGQFENFEGWKLKTGDKNTGDGFYTSQTGHMIGVYTTTPPDGTPEITGNDAINYLYTTPTWTRIAGDVYLQAESPEGNWLVFDENGKGGTYVAPQFVKKGQNTISPHATNADLGYPVTMQRYGYEFGGWYDTKEHADAHAADPSVTTGQFTFGQPLNDNTTIYASWISHTTAIYTVIIWKQNINADGYDFYESIPLSGNVGSTVNTVSQQGTGDGAYARVNNRNIQITGFHLKEYTQNVVITTENNAVVHVYYDRNEYTLTFRGSNYTTFSYVETTSNDGTQYAYVDGEYVQLTRNSINSLDGTTPYTGTVYYVTTSNNNIEQWGVVNGALVRLTRAGNMFNRYWTYNGNRYNGTRYVTSNNSGYASNNTQYGWNSTAGAMQQLQQIVTWTLEGAPYTGTRYVQQSNGTTNVVKTITALYQQNISEYFPIVGDNGVTYNNGERWNPQGSSIFSEVLVYIDIMPAENTIFQLDTANRPLKTMNWYIEVLPGETGTATAPNTLYDYNNNAVSSGGRQFTLYKSISARYNGVTRAEDFIELVGFDRLGADSQYDNNGFYIYSTTQDGTVNFYYTRKAYPILFLDGTYVDGNNNIQDEVNRGELSLSDNQLYGADISSFNDYTLDDYDGYTLEGWYLDESCTQPYTFTTMPEGGITVYAKWRLSQYRVFLHANAGEVVYDDQGNIVSDTRDLSLDWGSETQAMNFRISYGGTISVPTGLRYDYDFAGWYTDPACTKSFIPATQLNDQTVTTPYDKTTHFTDDMDQWSCLGPDPFNSDAIGFNGGDRFWITKEFNLYAKWRSKIVGADGMYLKFVTTDPDTDNDGTADDPGTGHFDEGTANVNADRTEYCDEELYVDGAFAYGLAACDAPEVAQGEDELHFRYWVVQEWNASLNNGQGGFEDGDTIVYPGERFETVYRYAQRVDVDPSDPSYNKPGTDGYDPDKPEHYYDYYMVLRAEYTPAIPQDTTLVYDANGGEFTSVPSGYTAGTADGFDVIIKDELLVNEVFDIQPGTIVTREGYEFKGWSLERDGEKFLDGGEQNYAADNLTTDPDGNDPSNTLYAIWEVHKYNVIVKKAIDNYGVSDAAWDAHGFTFHYSIANGGEYNVTDALVAENGVSVVNSADGSVMITNVPYGSTLCVWEELTSNESRFFTTDHDAQNMYVMSGFVSENDGDTLTEIVTITNTRVLGKIVITKDILVSKIGNEFETEKFMFKLELLKTVDGETVVDNSFTPMILTLSAGGSASVQVPAGKYRVTELTDWSWRHNATSDTSVDCEITKNNPNAAAPFTNQRNTKNWLSGEFSRDNVFTGGATSR